jgi:hypothetical protein
MMAVSTQILRFARYTVALASLAAAALAEPIPPGSGLIVGGSFSFSPPTGATADLGPLGVSFPASGQVNFAPVSYGSLFNNGLRFDPVPGGFSNVSPGHSFLAGYLSFTNGGWPANSTTEISLSFSSIASLGSPDYYNQTLTIPLELKVYSDDSSPQDSASNADWLFSPHFPGLGTLRVIEGQTGTVRVFAAFGSFFPTAFTGPTSPSGTAFLTPGSDPLPPGYVPGFTGDGSTSFAPPAYAPPSIVFTDYFTPPDPDPDPDPLPGDSQDNPLLPNFEFFSVDPFQSYWDFYDVPSGAWIDPPFVHGFSYSTSDLFTRIEFPNLPAFAGLTLESPWCGGVLPGTFGSGVGDQTSFDFLSMCGGAQQFTIRSGSPIFDAGNSAGFPLRVFFSAPSANVYMASVLPPPSAVPEPATMLLAGLGLVLASVARRFTNRRKTNAV